jgi:hypothetical protein
MRQPDRTPRHTRRLVARIAGALGLLLATGLLAAVPAFATYEQVKTFAGEAGNAQLTKASGMAVNYTGAGGVPAGTLYAVGEKFDPSEASKENARVVSYGPKGEFRQAWGWGVGDQANEFQRCGPNGEASFPTCASEYTGRSGSGAGQLSNPSAIAVDQTTGDVYVFNNLNEGATGDVVRVFSADGSQYLGGFGEKGKFGESIAEGPGKFHLTSTSNIAVDGSGTVYVADLGPAGEPGGQLSRAMVFKPETPGDYEHYAYTGRENDIAASRGNDEQNYFPAQLAVDAAGNLYTLNGFAVYEFAPGQPNTPICKHPKGTGGFDAFAVNQKTGEVFYHDYKDKKIHQLAPCDAEGQLVETGSFGLSPKPAQAVEIHAMAFDPALSYEASRPEGILYAADPLGLSDGKGFFGRGYIFAPPEALPPVVESEAASAVGFTTATLTAQINPKGNTTRYVFQYETEAQYEENEASDRFAGATEVPPGGALLGSGSETLGATLGIAGLQSDTEYRFRAVATNHCESEHPEEVCEGTGEAAGFHTFATVAPGLPDERAWELVSPAQKNGGEVLPAYPRTASCFPFICKPGNIMRHFPMRSSPDGEALVYEGLPFSATEGPAKENEYLARRGASGWQSVDLSPIQAGSGSEQGYEAFDPGLSKGLLYQLEATLSPEAPEGYANLYAQPTGVPLSLSPLLTAPPFYREEGTLTLRYAGASTDLSRVFFEANDALTEASAFAPEAIDGGAAKYNLYEWHEGRLSLVNVMPGNAETGPGAAFGRRPAGNTSADLDQAISADGARAFFEDEAGQLYVRIGGEETVAIPDPSSFTAASADGSQVLMSDGRIFGHLAEGPQEEADLTEGKGGFQGIVGRSEDLSHVYFVDSEVIAANEGVGLDSEGKPQLAAAGKNNLYAWEVGGSTRFVAQLMANDNTGGFGGGTWAPSPTKRTAEASLGGRWLAFLSEARLSGYDNTGPCAGNRGAGEIATGPCSEAFLYDSATNTLVCASCNPSGVRPVGPARLPRIERQNPALAQPHYLTDEGRLVFDSGDSLSPYDTNAGTVPGKAVEDVYEYEPEGVGTPPCKRATGCLSLISAGHEAVDSNFLAMDETGENVFFTTRDQLTLKDRDDALDVYDARIKGGIPAESEVARVECQGEACQAPVSVPNHPTPATSAPAGEGNVAPEKQAKKKQKHRKRQAKKKHAKKSSANRTKRNHGGAK